MNRQYGKVGPALRDVAASHPDEVAAAGEVILSHCMWTLYTLLRSLGIIAHCIDCYDYWTLLDFVYIVMIIVIEYADR